MVPTFDRPAALGRCLDALARQATPPDEIVVVVRDTDESTQAVLNGRVQLGLPIRMMTVGEPGQVRALNEGLAAARGDVIAFIDDDTAPRPQWLARIERHIREDPAVGGVGGRDWVHAPDGEVDDRSRERVGIVQWFGRVVGNHHLGVGPPREVDVLKGANMAFRAAAIRGTLFDERLRGRGAQLFNDLAFSLGVRRAGWKLIYDPQVAVDHYPDRSVDDPRSGSLPTTQLEASVHNQTLAILDHLPGRRRAVYILWAALAGTVAAPGLLQLPRWVLSGRPQPLGSLSASLRGRLAGWRAWRRGGAPRCRG